MTNGISTPSVTEDDRHELVHLRRELHQWPELAFQENETAALVARRLDALGLRVETGVAGTGVIGTLTGRTEGRQLLLRADMDALAIEEVVDRPYRSRNPGAMHACGHDGHVATLLTSLEILSRERAALGGTVTALFQPAEEVGGGSKRVVGEGVLERLKPDAALGLHYWTYLETGVIGVTSGPCMASVDEFHVTVKGQGGHAAIPQDTADALVASAFLVTALQTVVSRRTDPLEPAVVTVGELHSGTAFNIIPGEAHLAGTVRTFGRELWRQMPERIEEVVRGVCTAYGCTYQLDYRRHTSPLVNDPLMARLVRAVAEELVGHARVVEVKTMSGEDMAGLLEVVPGCFFFVGAGCEAKGITAPHHSAEFDLDEDALEIGAEMLVRLTRRFLAGAAN